MLLWELADVPPLAHGCQCLRPGPGPRRPSHRVHVVECDEIDAGEGADDLDARQHVKACRPGGITAAVSFIWAWLHDARCTHQRRRKVLPNCLHGQRLPAPPTRSYANNTACQCACCPPPIAACWQGVTPAAVLCGPLPPHLHPPTLPSPVHSTTSMTFRIMPCMQTSRPTRLSRHLDLQPPPPPHHCHRPAHLSPVIQASPVACCTCSSQHSHPRHEAHTP